MNTEMHGWGKQSEGSDSKPPSLAGYHVPVASLAVAIPRSCEPPSCTMRRLGKSQERLLFHFAYACSRFSLVMWEALHRWIVRIPTFKTDVSPAFII
jgi:hypothetical protein